MLIGKYSSLAVKLRDSLCAGQSLFIVSLLLLCGASVSAVCSSPARTTQSAAACAPAGIVIGELKTGTLSAEGCQDGLRGSNHIVSRYRFRAAARQQVAVEIESASFETFIYLIAPNGAVLYADRDSGGNKRSRIPASGMVYLPVSGAYTIEVTSWKPGAKGSFALRLQGVCNFLLTPSAVSFGAEGGSAKVQVTGVPGCAWNISEGPEWAKVSVDPESPGDLTVTAMANSAKPRTASFSIAGYKLAVSQASGDVTEDQDGDGIPDSVEALEKTNPGVRDNDIFNNFRLFARQQYRDFLGRESDRNGIDFWAGNLERKAITREQMLEGVYNSAEFQTQFPPVLRLYVAALQRIPDLEGLQNSLKSVRRSQSLAVIAQSIVNSSEFQSKHGKPDDPGYVRILYRNTYAREASQTEVDNWVKILAGGKTRGALLLDFSESPFFKEITATRVTASMLFLVMLRRPPQPQEFDNWVRSLNTGTTTLKAIEIFMATDAYRSRFLP